MLNKEDFLTRADMQVWARFLHSDAGQHGLAYLRRAFKRSPESTDATLIRNSVGFDAWQSCLDATESLGELPPKPEKLETDELER